MASSIETTSTTTTLKNNGNTYLSADTNDVVALANPLPLTSGGSGFSAANAVVQIVNVSTGAMATTATAIPWDDTIPQKTEGGEVMTLAITPKNTNNLLVIDVVAIVSGTEGGWKTATALFQDTTANALAVSMGYEDGVANQTRTAHFRHYMTAGTTSATTFKVRIGAQTTETLTFNGNGGSRKYGGVFVSSITITEYSV